MSSKEFVLGVDLDGVVADFMRGIRPIAAEWLGVKVDELAQEVSYGFPEWHLDEMGGYDALHRHAVNERGLFKSLRPLEGAPAALRRLAARGIRIRIITHRLYIEWFHKQAISQTTEWLEQFAIPYWDICFMKDKAAVGANLYLEDNPTNIQALRDAGCEVVVVVNSTNRDLAAPRAENWEEIEKLIMAAYIAWQRQA